MDTKQTFVDEEVRLGIFPYHVSNPSPHGCSLYMSYQFVQGTLLVLDDIDVFLNRAAMKTEGDSSKNRTRPGPYVHHIEHGHISPSGVQKA
ncbi:putative Phosphoethanolamine/phosphocholine phosphatase [Corchorus olitorius]|uniref:Phosphoethanolamine/phosphocholine phosphatase n=1 Tax=Corchorus olitorius TaxID=93759 RepID=A0A1R3J9F8_9ROSI|nr:putative Phosphoethanolamine/phosphocholine phosphatase [Corchorus olitorius]